jgi:hypothetical protein
MCHGVNRNIGRQAYGLTAVEKELAELKHAVAANKSQGATAWWEKMFGSFADSEGFEEAVRLGREYRESLRPKADGKAA